MIYQPSLSDGRNMPFQSLEMETQAHRMHEHGIADLREHTFIQKYPDLSLQLSSHP